MSFPHSKELSHLTIFSHSHSLWLMQLLYCCPLWTLPLSCLLSALAITQLIISFLLSLKERPQREPSCLCRQAAAVCSHSLLQVQSTIAWLHTFMTLAKKYCLLTFMPEVFPSRLTRHLFNVLRESVNRFRQFISGTTGYWRGHSQHCSVFCKVVTVFHSYKYLSHSALELVMY